MKTCVDCEEFEMDVERSVRLGEPLGICNNQIDKGYAIGNFNAEECDGFYRRKGNPNLIDAVDYFPDPISHVKEPFCDPGYTIDRWNPKEG